MRPIHRLGFALTLSLAAWPALARDRCDWRAVAWPGDQRAVETGLDLARDVSDGIASSNPDIRAIRALLDRARTPQRLGDISGAWQVRSLQVSTGHDFAYAYPFFKARIARDRCGWTFAKTTGSQRRTGVLRAIDGAPRALAFLGGATVNNDPIRAYSRIAIRYDERSGTLSLAPREGKGWAGMPRSQVFNIRWETPGRALDLEGAADRSVTYTGRAVSVKRP